MGKLKNMLPNVQSGISSHLLRAGFRYTSYVCGGPMGYQANFSVEDGQYYTYVHCDLENAVLRIYKEFECGGEISSYQCAIPENLLSDDEPDAFMDWLDSEAEDYL